MTLLTRLAAPLLGALLAVASTLPASAGMGDRPGDFDYYALVLSWSPSFCLSGNGAHADDPQCGTVRPYAFVLHGLWPQFDKGWPEDCATGGDTQLSPEMVQSLLDIMPSEKLVGHEFAKHGTCSGLDAKGYLGLARKLFTSINIPSNYVKLQSRLDVSLADLRSDLLRANPQLTPDMIAVNCDKHGELVEVHFCFTKDGQPRACGHNEIQAKMCRQDTVFLPPVRGHAAGGADTTSTASPSAEQAPAAGSAPVTTTVQQPAPAPVAPAPAINPPPAKSATADAGSDQTGTADANASGDGNHRHRHHRHHHHHRHSNGNTDGGSPDSTDTEDDSGN